MGATLVCGGKWLQEERLKDGYFVEPTIFTEVGNGTRIAREEIFGPVLWVIPFEDEGEMIRQNGARYGLAAGVWTGQIRRAH